jgi:charged multivesicular body protein 7
VHKLHGMLDAIDRARDQVAMVRAMETSAGVLRELHRETGGAEHVADVVDALGEQMANVEEVTGVLNEANAGAVDEGEVEDEFEELMKEEKVKEDKKREEEEARRTAERMMELEEWERQRREKEEEETRKKEQERPDNDVETEVEKRREELQEMHLA